MSKRVWKGIESTPNTSTGVSASLLDFDFLMDEHAMPISDLAGFLQVNVDTGLDHAVYKQRFTEEGPNIITSTCPLWLSLLLPCVKQLAPVRFYWQLKPKDAVVKRRGNLVRVQATTIVRGDIIAIRAGDVIPADARILKCSDDCKVDRSRVLKDIAAVSQHYTCTPDITDAANALSSRNMLFMGYEVVSGTATAIVLRTGNLTFWAHVLSAGSFTSVGGSKTSRRKKLNDHVV